MRLAHEQAGVALADAEAAKAQARADVEVARMQVRVSWSGSIEAAHLVHFGSSGFCLHSPAARCPVVISVISAQARAEALKEAQEAAALRKPLRLRSTLGRTLSDATAAATISTTSAVAQEHQRKAFGGSAAAPPSKRKSSVSGIIERLERLRHAGSSAASRQVQAALDGPPPPLAGLPPPRRPLDRT